MDTVLTSALAPRRVVIERPDMVIDGLELHGVQLSGWGHGAGVRDRRRHHRVAVSVW
jgi:hypothetical protein